MKKYLTNYYYLHPKHPKSTANQTTTKYNTAVQCQPISPVRRKGSMFTQTATQTVPPPQEVVKKSSVKIIETKVIEQPQTIPVRTKVSIPKKRQMAKSQILLEIFTQIAYEVQKLQEAKKEVILKHILVDGIFRLLGSQGWKWMTDEQFIHGLSKLQIKFQTYQAEMLYKRISRSADMLQIDDFTKRLMKPLENSDFPKKLLEMDANSVLIRGDRLQAVKQLFSKALLIEYYVFLIKQLMQSESWNYQTILQILVRQKMVAEVCELADLQQNMQKCSKRQILLLYLMLSDENTGLLNEESMKNFLLDN